VNGNSSALATTCSSYSELGDKALSKVKAHGKAHWPLKHAAQGNPQAQRHHLECQVHGQHQMFDPSIKTKDSLLGQAPSCCTGESHEKAGGHAGQACASRDLGEG